LACIYEVRGDEKMLNWEKINTRLEKEKVISWGRKKELDEDGNEIIIDYVFTSIWGFMTKNLSPKALGILYARFEVLPNDDELLSVHINFSNKNIFTTQGSQININKHFMTYFDKEFECELKDTKLIYTMDFSNEYHIYETQNLENPEYVFLKTELFDLVKITDDTSILKILKDFYIVSDDTSDKMLFIGTEPQKLPEYLK
jgi:hypothetical protein